jgi:nuclear pore complex protein Nup205
MRVIGAAIVSRGAHNVPQGRRFLTEHRMLVMHVLKRSAGIAAVDRRLEELVAELADAFMVLIAATGFLEFEDGQGGGAAMQQRRKGAPVLFH